MAIPSNQAYLTQAPTGVPGDITRPDLTAVEPAMLVAVTGVFAQACGIAMKYTTGGIQQFNGGAEVAADFAGVLVREAPSIPGSGAADLVYNPLAPYASAPVGMVTRGYINVVCAAGTPVRGGVVYVQITLNAGVVPGSFRADGTDSGNAIALTVTQATWATPGKDANNNAELRVYR